MKISAAVLMETLGSLGNWTLKTNDGAAYYAYPHLFAGFENSDGHIVVASPDELAGLSGKSGGLMADRSGKSDGLMAVLSAPVPEPEDLPFPALVPESPVPKEEIWLSLTGLFDRLEKWDDSISLCSSDLNGIRRMLGISSREMKGDLVLIDVSYNIPAYTDTGASDIHALVDKEKARATEQTIAGLAEDPQIASARTLKGVHYYESDLKAYGAPCSLYRNMFRKGEKGYYNRLLFLRSSGEYNELDRLMLEYLSRKVELITEHLSTYAIPLSGFLALKQQLLKVPLPSYDPDVSSLASLSPLGWRSDDTYQFFIFQSLYETRDAGITDYILRNLEKLLPGSCGAADEGRILLIRNNTRSGIPFSKLRSSLADFLRENLYKTGISNDFYNFSSVRGAYLQAEAALDLGGERDPMFWYYMFEDYLSDYIAGQAARKIPSGMLVLPALYSLVRHDRERGTSYAETLRVLGEENYNTTHAASKLFIHRSTLQDRLERIHQLVDLDFDDSETRALLWFGFRLLEKR